MSVQAQQRSSSAAVQQKGVGALSPMPSCLGIGGYPGGSRQGHPRHTGGKAVGGQSRSDSRCTANMVAELVVKNR